MVLDIFFFVRMYFDVELGMDFLQQLEAGFDSCGLSCRDFFSPGKTVGLGVSGGADSMALLYGAFLLRNKYWGKDGAALQVVTVNHNIRPPEESGGDAAFVQRFCSGLDAVQCTIVDLPPGLVAKTAQSRRRGVEEAARFLRYEAFQREAKAADCQFFLLAHNQNDQLETLLLRFLQGSGDAASQGIPLQRGIFVRPLLQVGRHAIEVFLISHQVEFRSDSTNQENDYLRNRCRNLLIPLLDKDFCGWQKGVLSGSEKRQDDNDLISSLVPSDLWQEGEGESLVAPWDRFLSLHAALRRRVLYEVFNRFGVDSRIPYHLLRPLVQLPATENRSLNDCLGVASLPAGLFTFGSVQVEAAKEGLVVRKKAQQGDARGFALVIDGKGEYCLPMGRLSVDEVACCENGACERALLVGEMCFLSPIVVRSPEPGDKVLVRGKVQSAQEILSKSQKGQFVAVVEEVGKETVELLSVSSFCKKRE